MTTPSKILSGIIAVLVLAFGFFFFSAKAPTKLGAVYGNPAYVTTSTATQATTTLYAFAGILHTISITKPVAGSVITIYDSATTTAPMIAPLVITVPASPTSTPFTLTIDGIFNNGLTIQQATATSTVNVTYQQN